MKFSAVTLSAVTLFAAAAAAAPSAVAPRADSAVYDVMDFQALCVPHIAQCSYAFRVRLSNAGENNGVSCSATSPASTGGSLPEIKEGACISSSRTFTVAKTAEGGLTLSLSQQVSPVSYTVGVHDIQSSELHTSIPGNPQGSYQYYTGPTDFSLVSANAI